MTINSGYEFLKAVRDVQVSAEVSLPHVVFRTQDGEDIDQTISVPYVDVLTFDYLWQDEPIMPSLLKASVTNGTVYLTKRGLQLLDEFENGPLPVLKGIWEDRLEWGRLYNHSPIEGEVEQASWNISKECYKWEMATNTCRGIFEESEQMVMTGSQRWWQ